MRAFQFRAFGLAIVLFILGLINIATFPQPGLGRSQRWLESVAPTRLKSFELVSSGSPLAYDDQASEAAFESLKPYGIVGRTFTDGKHFFDGLVVASNWRGSFHPPTNCLPLQSWSIQDSRIVRVRTELRGVVPMTLCHGVNPNGPYTVAFCYKDPIRFVATKGEVDWDWIRAELTSTKTPEGSMYRFIMPGPSNDDLLLKFGSAYLDASALSSGGFL